MHACKERPLGGAAADPRRNTSWRCAPRNPKLDVRRKSNVKTHCPNRMFGEKMISKPHCPNRMFEERVMFCVFQNSNQSPYAAAKQPYTPFTRKHQPDGVFNPGFASTQSNAQHMWNCSCDCSLNGQLHSYIPQHSSIVSNSLFGLTLLYAGRRDATHHWIPARYLHGSRPSILKQRFTFVSTLRLVRDQTMTFLAWDASTNKSKSFCFW